MRMYVHVCAGTCVCKGRLNTAPLLPLMGLMHAMYVIKNKCQPHGWLLTFGEAGKVSWL